MHGIDSNNRRRLQLAQIEVQEKYILLAKLNTLHDGQNAESGLEPVILCIRNKSAATAPTQLPILTETSYTNKPVHIVIITFSSKVFKVCGMSTCTIKHKRLMKSSGHARQKSTVKRKYIGTVKNSSW